MPKVDPLYVEAVRKTAALANARLRTRREVAVPTVAEASALLADDAFFGLRFAHFFLRHYDSLIKVGNSVPKSFQGYFLLVAERVRT